MKREINEKFPDKSLIIEPMPLDLASFKSTKDFTVAFKEKQLPLHILINNAATMGSSTTAGKTGRNNNGIL
jgi:WW domain-containing oxidoreductase